MKISVAIASYNGEKYIIEQLDSILGQTLQIDEVIICDDKSSDRTVELVEGFINAQGLSGKWLIKVNTENLGYASNFVQAVKKTSGDLIFFCDQDDIWLPERVAIMAGLMEAQPNILMLGSESESFASSEDAPSVASWERKRFKRDNTLEHLKFKADNIFIGCQGCSMCIRKSLWQMIEDYWYPGWAHDEFVWKLALCLDGAYIYHGITLRRRLHTSNVTMHKMRDLAKRIKFVKDLKRSHEATLTFANKIHMEKSAVRLLVRNIEAARLRIDLMQNKKLLGTLKLLFCYFDCYHSRKSILVELYMAIKG